MRRLLALALLLGGCDDLQFKRQDDPGTMYKVAEHEAKIIGLEAEIERLKRDQERDREFLVAVHNSLKATDDAHEALRATVNKNVQTANRHMEEYRQHVHR